MKLPTIPFFMVSIIFLTSCSPPSNDELLIAIDEFNDAFSNGNTSALESMITENYLHSNGSAPAIRKEDWLSYLRKREAEIKSGDLEVIGYLLDEVIIEMHGQSAIVTGKITSTIKRGETVTTSQYRVTNFWVYESGNWKRAGFHDGKIVE